jgi:hypothetical protein
VLASASEVEASVILKRVRYEGIIHYYMSHPKISILGCDVENIVYNK